MTKSESVFELWKLSLVTVVAIVLLIDLHLLLRNLSTSTERVADSYVQQSMDVSNSAEEMAAILLPPENRKEYRELAVRGHHVLLSQMRAALDEAAQNHSQNVPSMATTAFYTTDDGVTWFADDINKLAPFDKGGKPAYRVYVYKCPDGKQFVSHLERYTEPAKNAIEAARAKGGGVEDPTIYETISMTGMEVKDPMTGDKGWVKQGDFAAAAKITEPRCADGTTNGLEPVVPD